MLVFRAIFCVLMVCCFGRDVLAQEAIIPFSDYFQKQLALSKLQGAEDSIYPEFNPAIFDKIEVRTESDEFDFNRQEFQLRLSPNGVKYRKIQTAIYEDLIQDYQLQSQGNDSNQLVAIYESWLEAYYNIKKLELYKKKEIVQRDLLMVLSKREMDGSLDVYTLTKAKREHERLNARVVSIQNRIIGWTSKTSKIEPIISMEQIQTYLLKIGFEDIAYEDKARDLYQLQSLNNQYEKERIENAKVFDFVQFRYRGPNVNPWEEKLSLGLGFNIPQGKNKSLDIVEIELDKKRELQQIEFKSAEHKFEIEKRITTLQYSLSQYFDKKKLIEKLDYLDENLINYTPRNKKELIELLKLKEDSYSDQIDLLDLEEEVYEDYLALLLKSGQFRLIPKKNLFSGEN